MITYVDIDDFTGKYITKRAESLLKPDLDKYHTELGKRLNGKSVLVIGGAGTIGSHYIKALLRYHIGRLVVVDINENGLTELVRDLRSSTGYNIPQEFIERLGKRQPWSCPLGIRRFFVSPRESGELCMIASVLGESGDIIFPKLNEERDMISFDAVAHDLLHYLGMQADICATEQEAREKALLLNESSVSYPVYFFETDTSGEKPYEEFFTEGEVIDTDKFTSLGVIKNSVKRESHEIDEIFVRLRTLFGSGNVTKADVVEILREYQPNFEHIEKGKGLDSKM